MKSERKHKGTQFWMSAFVILMAVVFISLPVPVRYKLCRHGE